MIHEKLFQPYSATLAKELRPQSLRRDVLAGVRVALVSLPLALALGLASGLTPAQGLMGAVVGSFFLALLGGSRVQIAGPSGILAVLSYGIVVQYGLGGLVLALFLAGLLLLAIGVFRLGGLVRYIPQPIVLGLTAGIALTLFLGQTGNLLGLAVPRLGADFVTQFGQLAAALGTIQPASVTVGGATLLLLLIFMKLLPRWPVAVLVLGLVAFGTAFFNVHVVTLGDLYGQASFVLPVWNLQTINYPAFVALLPPAFTIALLVALESYQSATVSDALTGGRYRPDTDVIAQGAANLVLAVLGGTPVAGSVERSVANVRFGARSPVAGLTHAGTLLFILLFLLPWSSYLPAASLAAVVVVLGIRMTSWKDLPQTMKTTRSDAVALAVTLLVTVFVNQVFAILSGLIVSSFFFMRSIAHSSSVQISSGRTIDPLAEQLPPGTTIVDLTGAFFFGAATKFEQTFHDLLPQTQTLILRMRDLTLLDASGTRVLERLLANARAKRVRVAVTEASPDLLRVLEHAGLIQALGPGNLYASLDGVLKDLRSTQPLVFSIHPDDATLDPI
ncbi:MAG: SulP family inorganic anion transporter [Spirochaetales bacterium]|nr:SulP family inorganic anion transporter [Spirochaetales bacterium]